MTTDRNLLGFDEKKYRDSVQRLEGYITQLDSKITDYDSLRKRLTTFVEEGDENYETYVQIIEKEAKACKNYKMLVEDKIKALYDVLDAINFDFGGKAKEVLTDTIDHADELVDVVELAAGLLD